MKNYLRAGCALCLTLCAGVAYLSWRPDSMPVTSAKKEAAHQAMDEQVEAKAKQARAGDEESIRGLADALFDAYAPVLPGEATGKLKERLVRAELKFRLGNKGVREHQVVKAVNRLAEKFGAPEHAKTSPLQVRILRAGLKESVPSLISPDDDEERGLKKRVGRGLRDDLSPLEAAFVTMMLIQQKMLNPDWQLSPQEFAEKQRANSPKPAAGANAGGGRFRLATDERDRSRSVEMMSLVGRRVSRLSGASVEELITEATDALGVGK